VKLKWVLFDGMEEMVEVDELYVVDTCLLNIVDAKCCGSGGLEGIAGEMKGGRHDEVGLN
jgi:hypothetical protein